MSKSFVIEWKSKVNGRAGKGTKHFHREEAERLAAELNREYPDIEHRAVPQEAGLGPPAEQRRNRLLSEPSTGEAAEGAPEPAPFLSRR